MLNPQAVGLVCLLPTVESGDVTVRYDLHSGTGPEPPLSREGPLRSRAFVPREDESGG